MERVLLARHGESELSIRGIVNGDPAVQCRLTATGRRQARDLGRALAGENVGLCVTTDFERCLETARIALPHPATRRLVVEELGDIRAGRFEGGSLDDYLRWAHRAPAAEPAPGGGESRADAARRFARGIELVLARPEPTALVVCHQLTCAYVLAGARGEGPPARIAPVPHALTHAVTRDELARAAVTLERWARGPDW